MGFVDKKTRIVDMSLTDRGRELLAQGQLQIVAYAFSDEMIDYSGSLNQALQSNLPLDTVIYRNHIPLQSNQMNQTGLHRDLASFLYTAPEQRDVLPVMTLTQTTASLQRQYKEQTYEKFVAETLNNSDGTFVVLVTMDDSQTNKREKQYLMEQNLAMMSQSLPQVLRLAKT